MSDSSTPTCNEDIKPADGSFEASYAGVPAWDIGCCQPEFLRVFDGGEIEGFVLDCGCGTGEHAIELARRGHEVFGIDFAPTAIEKARIKASERGVEVRFKVHDALNLEALEEEFDAVIDSGVFHCFSDENRAYYVRSLTNVVRPDGRLILICFNEHETRPGPRRVTQAELRAAFAKGWSFNYIFETRFMTHAHEGGAQAWIASLQRDA